MDCEYSPWELAPHRVKCIACDRLLNDGERGPACADCEHSWKCWACECRMDNQAIREAMASYSDEMLAASKAEERHLLCEDCRGADDEAAEAQWEARQEQETGADRCPPRE